MVNGGKGLILLYGFYFFAVKATNIMAMAYDKPIIAEGFSTKGWFVAVILALSFSLDALWYEYHKWREEN